MTTRTDQSTRTAFAHAVGAERVRPGEPADAVGGVVPGWVVSVADTEQTSAAMLVAAEAGLTVVARGAGSRIDWGAAPASADVVLDTSPISGVVEHAAGDLVLRARAGTPIAEIQRTAAAAGQQLSIDQPLESSTVGGVIATAATGPGRLLHGGVRDLLIGITVVRADGAVTTSGGKVVKNVAGYDLGKIYTGSYGTLGVITEAIFRLHPLGDEHRWITLTTDDPARAADAVATLRASQAVPTAVELDRPEPAAPITVCAHLEGRPDATHRRSALLAERLGEDAEVVETAPPWWGGYPFDPAAGIGIRLSVEPAAVGDLLTGVRRAAEHTGLPVALRGSAGLGTVHAGLAADADPRSVARLVERLRAVTAEHGGHAVVLRAPTEVADLVDLWGPVADGVLTLMRRTKDQFDPDHRLAPGRFVGGL